MPYANPLYPERYSLRQPAGFLGDADVAAEAEGGMLTRIQQGYGQFLQSNEALKQATGVSATDLELGGTSIGEALEQVAGGAQFALGAGAAAQTLAGLTVGGQSIAAAVGMSAAALGGAIAGVAAAGWVAFKVGEAVSNATKARNRRDSMRDVQDEILELVLTPSALADANARQRVRLRLDEWVCYQTGIADEPVRDRAPCIYAGWSAETASAYGPRYHWLDGDRGTRRGVSDRFGRWPEERYRLYQAFLDAHKELRNVLRRVEDDRQRRVAFAVALVAGCGFVGDPLAGIEDTLGFRPQGIVAQVEFGLRGGELVRGMGGDAIDYAALFRRTDDGASLVGMINEREYGSLPADGTPILRMAVDVDAARCALLVRFADGSRYLKRLSIAPGFRTRATVTAPSARGSDALSRRVDLPGGPIYADSDGGIAFAAANARALDEAFPVTVGRVPPARGGGDERGGGGGILAGLIGLGTLAWVFS